MNPAIRCGALAVFALLFCLAGSGCSKSGLKPTGKIVKNGEPFKLSEKGLFVISVSSADEKDAGAMPVNSKPYGTFEVVGKEGKGIPAGKYRFSVQAIDPYTTTGKDMFNGRFYGDKSPFVEDIKGNQEIILDIGKHDGGKGK